MLSYFLPLLLIVCLYSVMLYTLWYKVRHTHSTVISYWVFISKVKFYGSLMTSKIRQPLLKIFYCRHLVVVSVRKL